MYDINKLLPKKQFKTLIRLLPKVKQKKEERRKVNKESLVNGILQVLINGISWNKIADCGCSDTSCYRFFKELQRRGKLKLIYWLLTRTKTDITVGAIDTSTVTSFAFKSITGWSGKHRVIATNISLFADQRGLPADVEFGKGSDNDRIFVKRHLENTFGRLKKVLNLDMMYMGLILRREMRKKGIKVNMEVREQDYHRKIWPKFKLDKEKYRVRFLVERAFAWIKSFRRLRIRREYNIAMFKAFVYLALIIILIRY